MQFTHFIGIDISKSYLDWSVLHQAKQMEKKRTKNECDDIRAYVQQLLLTLNVPLCQVLFTMEHTGLYNYRVLEVLEELQATIWQVSPLHLKRSMGIQRGKSDPVDAQRIALFSMRHKDEFRPHLTTRAVVLQIKSLFALRRILVKSSKSLKMQLSELEFIETNIQNSIQTHIESVLSHIVTKMKHIEQQMIQLIHNDTRLSRLFLITSSVVGVGPIVAIKILLVTNEFKRFTDARKLACQAGVAPFGERSGTSVFKPDRVSNMADHELKNLLHLAALAAIRTEGEMKEYYLRKKAQNKPSMSVINAVRNKIVHRICACVKADRVYQRDYQHPLKAA